MMNVTNMHGERIKTKNKVFFFFGQVSALTLVNQSWKHETRH